MKLFNNYKWLLIIGCIIAIFACSKLEDSYDEFTVDGETVYLGQPVVSVVSGFEKVRFTITTNSDPKITNGVLRTIDGSIEQAFTVNKEGPGSNTTFVDMDLAEGDYRFETILMDDNGNESISVATGVTVLGESYLNSLSARQVGSITFDKGDGTTVPAAVINFDQSFEDLIGLRATYTNSSGEEVIVDIDAGDDGVRIEDFMGASDLKLQSIYAPENPFNEFIAPSTASATLPPCNALAELTASSATLSFTAIESREVAFDNFTVQSDQCIDGAVTLAVSGDYFKIGTDEAGPFDQSLQLENISSPITIYVEFAPNAQVDGTLEGSITVSATNILDTEVLKFVGGEIGVVGGIQKHPVEMRSSASAVFTDDVNTTMYGTVTENLWDGNFGWPSVNHSSGNLPLPIGFFTVDLGDDFDIAEISWAPRSDCCSNRSQRRYQYWGLPGNIDPASAITTTEFNGKPENQMLWEQEMTSKGWISLGQFEIVEDDVINSLNNGTLISDKITSVNFVRYVRVVILQTFEGDTHGTINFSELDFQVNLD